MTKHSRNPKKYALKHTRKHPHLCILYNIAFTTPINRKIYTLTHNREWLHECSLCNEAFKTSRNLKIHTLKHNCVRPHKCILCDKAFTTSSTYSYIDSHWGSVRDKSFTDLFYRKGTHCQEKRNVIITTFYMNNIYVVQILKEGYFDKYYLFSHNCPIFKEKYTT